MTGGEGSKPVYWYNRSKRVRENAKVRQNTRLRKFSQVRWKRKVTTNVRRQKKRSSNSKYKQGIGRFIRKLLK